MYENNSSNVERRQVLLNEMESLAKSGINCSSCSGTCCTSFANSMQITQIEALDILHFLKSEGRFNEELKNNLIKCIDEYRLDYEISTTRGIPIRRTYTCPFFEPGPKGCSIDLRSKPYGCLAFNPNEKNSKGGAACSSNKEILKQIPTGNLNKKNIPMALLDIWDLI